VSTQTLFTTVVLLVAGCGNRPSSFPQSHAIASQKSEASANAKSLGVRHHQGRTPSSRRARSLAATACPPGQKMCGTVCQQCCVDNDCRLTPEVATAVCGTTGPSLGTCSIATCVDRWLDLNKVYADGCECANNIFPKSCDQLPPVKTLAVGQSQTIVGDLPLANETNWFGVNFAYVNTLAYHPFISVVSSSASPMVMDVSTSCGGSPIACPAENSHAVAVSNWEVIAAAGDPSRPNEYQPTPSVGTVYFKVYRQSGALTCDHYTVTIKNSVP
jgi:hypothetical protein